MKQSLFHGRALAEKYLPPCQEMPNIVYNHGIGNLDEKIGTLEIMENMDNIVIVVTYPDKWKIITQSQAVDIHALIGNIGGYIGLFLGTIYSCSNK